MSFQNTIKCMKKYNRYAVREANYVVEGLKTSETSGRDPREEEAVKQCFKLNEILDDMKNVNFEDVEIGENEETIHSPRIANLKKKKEEIELRLKEGLTVKPRKPNKPVIPKIINSKIANTNNK